MDIITKDWEKTERGRGGERERETDRDRDRKGGEWRAFVAEGVLRDCLCVCVCVRRIRCISDETGLESESSILLLTTSPLNE